MDNLRVGNGFDVHPFIMGRDLVLGGEKIEFKFGLAGHSDADVVIHAIIDSLLGAAGMGDIGGLFPDTDSSYTNISSIILLKEVNGRLRSHNITIINIDVVVVCQEPKIAPHVNAMKKNIAGALIIDESRISIKGKTTEGLGFTGRGEGIACSSMALLRLAP